jgi:hypothetical protein
MKRISAILVAMVMLMMCTSSFGYFLIYNASSSVKGVNGTAAASIAWKGYLVMNLNDSTDELVDANLVMYGKDSNKNKVYVVLNQSDSDGFLHTDLWSQGNFVVFNLWSYVNPFDFEGLVIGKGAVKDVGFGSSDLKWVGSSIKGTSMVWDGMLLDPDDEIAATGTISASLYTVATKAVNTYGMTQDQIVVSGYLTYPSIIQLLQSKGYVAATLP